MPLGLPSDATATGESQGSAQLIVEGTYGGSLPDNGESWYKIAVPAGKAVYVSFDVLTGDSWNDIILVDAIGSQVRWVSTGSTGSYDPEDAEAWLLVDAFWGEMTYSFTVSLINAPPQNDAGSGTDAGQRAEFALGVAPGRIVGSVREAYGDVGDWYRFSPTVGSIVDIHSTTATLNVYSNVGDDLGCVVSYDSSFCTRTLTFVSDGSPFLVEVRYGTSYQFTVNIARQADITVTAVEIREIEITTPAGPSAISLQREVTISVTNVGEGPSRAASLDLLTVHEGPTGYRLVGHVDLNLGAGESATVVLPWDTKGQVGDFKLVARVSNEYESNVENNELARDVSLHITGLGAGIDALNHRVVSGGLTLAVEYGGERIGVSTPVGFIGSQDGSVVVLP